MTAANGIPTFRARWHRAVATRADAPFLVWTDASGRVTTWTYREFDDLIGRVRVGLCEHGVGRGDAVHLVLPNSPAFVAVWLACVDLGAWIVPSDPSASGTELAQHRLRTGAVLSVGCAATEAALTTAAEESAGGIVIVEVDDTTVQPLASVTPEARRSWRVKPLTRAAVMFTSGTTSAPKGVEVTQANYAFAGDVMAAAAGLGPDDRQLVVLPLFHANAQYYSFASAISVGASVALEPSFSASGFLAAAARTGATHASLFAAPMRMILAKDPAPEPELRLRHCWFAQNLTEAQHDRLTELLGCRPRQLYGMTETIPAVVTSDVLDATPDVMGTPTLGCAVELRDPVTGAPTPQGEIGEIVVGGRPGVELFRSYLDDPTTTADSFRDGWFRTGDRAVADPDGRLRFDGRRSDVLKVAGENVSIVEVEETLARHPAVLEVAVVARPDPIRDEVPVAYVVAHPGALLDPSVLVRHAEDNLARSKRPAEYHIVDELPRTSVGKIRKFLLRDPAPTGGTSR